MAYAALLSLMQNIEGARYPAGYSPRLRKKSTETLRNKIAFLREFLELYPHRRRSKRMEILEAQIRGAADAAEDIFESHMVDFTLAESTAQRDQSFTLFCLDVQFVLAELDSIKEEAMMIKDAVDQGPKLSGAAASSPRSSSSPFVEDCTTVMVGVDEVFNQIMSQITGQETNLKIFPIHGMGGIGKTTLARKIYHSSLAVNHFDIRAWTTISQEYNVRDLFLGLLCDVSVSKNQTTQDGKRNFTAFRDDKSKLDDCQLREMLYQSLMGRKYLIVLDDLWSQKAWGEIRRFFPDNSQGSRIVVTTRLSDVARQFDSLEPYRMSLLKADESWELLHKHVFREDDKCPSELEEIGKRILTKCKGLPLAIIVVGGLLSKCDKTKEYWEHVAEDTDTILNSEGDDHCLNILSLSYIHLPIHLKPCFLYLGIFPEASYIRFSKLIKLWVSEGFLKPCKTKTLEEVAEEYLKDLIGRNLVLACRVGYHGELKGCRMHDLLRDLCIREASRENFLYMRKTRAKAMECERRFIIHQQPKENDIHNGLSLVTLARARSFLCSIKWLPTPKIITSNCRLLRILDTVDRFSINDILRLVNSRYLAFNINVNVDRVFPSLLSQLGNLQTLIVESSGSTPVILPFKIWEMPQLRHLKFSLVCLPELPDHVQTSPQDSCVLENLQTLSRVLNLKTTLEVVRRIPNVKKLKLFYEDSSTHSWPLSSYCLNNLVHLHKLESLELTCPMNEMIYPGELHFPSSLKKLTLLSCRLYWEHMSTVSSLPNLEELRLVKDAFIGQEWKTNEGQFPELKFLYISSTDLECWYAESEHFPKLEILALDGCLNLKEIPRGVGEIPTLKLISLCSCHDSAADSVREILKEQRDNYGNEDLNVTVMDGASDQTRRLSFIPPLYAGLISQQLTRLLEELEHWGIPTNHPTLDEEHGGSTPINTSETASTYDLVEQMRLDEEHGGSTPINTSETASTYDLVEQMNFLYINVVKARDLPVMDISGSLDPYVEVKVGNNKGVTQHLEKNQYPVWNSVFAFSKERRQSNLIEVTVKDKDLGKDFMGKVLFDVAEVPQRVPPDSPLAPQWYCLADKRGDKVSQGKIMLAVWMGTQADEAFPEAWHSDAQNVSQQSLVSTRSKVYFSPNLYYLRVHIIAAEDLVPSDKGRQPHAFVKVQLGFQTQVTRLSQMKHINTEWNEELFFVASEPFDESIFISVEDRVDPGKDEVIGRVIIPIRKVPQRVETTKLPDVRLFFLQKPSLVEEESEREKEVKFAGRILLRFCIDSGYHVMDEPTHFNSDLQPSSKHLRKPNIGILEVGILSAQNLLPMKSRDGKMTNAYCVAKYGNKWVRTRTLLDTLHTRWNEHYTWEVYDPYTVITIGVFDNCHINGKEDSRDRTIGKVRIRLSTLETDRLYTHAYPLLVLSPSGLKKHGELHLAIRFTCTAWTNMVVQYGKPLFPKMHYVQPIGLRHLDWLRHQVMQIVAAKLSRAEPPLRREIVEYMLNVDYNMWSLRRSKANLQRIMSLLSGISYVCGWFNRICHWKNPLTTILVHVLFLIPVCYPELILPTIFLYLFVIGLWNYLFRPSLPSQLDARLSQAETTYPDELDEEFDTFPTSRSTDTVSMRYNRLRSVAGRVQTVVGDIATQGERALSLLSWRDGRATVIFMIFLLILAVFLYVTPFQVVAVLIGLYILRHPWFRGKRPSVPVNFFNRLPARSDSLLYSSTRY